MVCANIGEVLVRDDLENRRNVSLHKTELNVLRRNYIAWLSDCLSKVNKSVRCFCTNRDKLSVDNELVQKIAWRLVMVLFVTYEPASWSSRNAFVRGAGGLRFKSRADQIGHSVANG